MAGHIKEMNFSGIKMYTNGFSINIDGKQKSVQKEKEKNCLNGYNLQQQKCCKINYFTLSINLMKISTKY